jgi:hypothetical protein
MSLGQSLSDPDTCQFGVTDVRFSGSASSESSTPCADGVPSYVAGFERDEKDPSQRWKHGPALVREQGAAGRAVYESRVSTCSGRPGTNARDRSGGRTGCLQTEADRIDSR